MFKTQTRIIKWLTKSDLLTDCYMFGVLTREYWMQNRSAILTEVPKWVTKCEWLCLANSFNIYEPTLLKIILISVHHVHHDKHHNDGSEDVDDRG